MAQDVNNQSAPLGTHLVPGNEVRAFGGSTLAALLRATAAAVGSGSDPAAEDTVRPHSFHAHFLGPASPSVRLDLLIRVLNRSHTFANVAVEARQHARTVATATASFHRPRPSRTHTCTTTAPTFVPGSAPPAYGGAIPAEDRPSRRDFDFRFADDGAIPGSDGRPLLRYWVRYRGALEGPVDHAVALTWISDLCLTRVADLEHETSPGVRQAASLDHAAWYHRPFDLSDWLLYETSSPSYADEIALSTGRFFADGVLVASAAQQSLLRRRA